MYAWKISTKFFWFYIIDFLVFLLIFLTFAFVMLGMALSFKKEANASSMNIKFVSADIVYKDYEDKFNITTGSAQNVLFHFYDENGNDAINSVDLATKFVKLNDKNDNLIGVLTLLSSIQFVAALFLIFVAAYQRRNPTYTFFALVGSLLKFLVTFGVTYWLYFVGLILEIIAVIFIINDYKKIKEENYKIMHRDLIYKK